MLRPSKRAPNPHLLERERELSVVQAAVTGLAAEAGNRRGRPAADSPDRFILLDGNAGLGKTTLITETARMAAHHGLTVLSATGGERERERHFHIVRQLFRPLLLNSTEADRAALLGDWREIVAPAVGLAPAQQGAPPDTYGVHDGLHWLIDALTARRGPAVLIVDDAHWADRESLTWLEGFTQTGAGKPVLVVLARRPEEPVPDPGLHDRLAHTRGARRLDLRPLSGAAVTALVRDRLGTDAEPGFCTRILEVTDGVPFIVREVLAVAGADGLAPTADGARGLDSLASTVIGHGVVERLGRLGPDATALARATAVLGADARPAHTAALAGLTPQAAIAAEAALRDARILGQGTGDTYTALHFQHPTVATAVYQGTPPDLRNALHTEAAHHLVERDTDLAAAAGHLHSVRPGGDRWAVTLLRRAADQALRAGAPESACRHLERALDEPPEPPERARILYELGFAAFLDNPGAAISHLRAARELCDGGGVEDKTLHEAIVIRLAKSMAHDGQVADAVRLLEAEADATAVSRARLRLQAEHFMLALFLFDNADNGRRARRLRNLVTRLSGADRTERALMGMRAWYGVLRGDPAVHVLDHAHRAVVDPISWTDGDWTFEIPLLTALTFVYGDQPEKSEELYAAGIADLEAHGWRGTHLSPVYSIRGQIALHCGRLADAEADSRFALELADRLGPMTPPRWYAVSTLLRVLIARGKLDQAEKLATDYDFHAPYPQVLVFPIPQWVHGELHLAQGRMADAVTELTEAGARLDARQEFNPAWCHWRSHLALALADSDPAEALRLARVAVDHAYRFGAPSALGYTLRVLGVLTGGDEGTRLLEEALMWLEPSPSRHVYAAALVDMGTLLRRTGALPQARKRLTLAVSLAEECGADGLLETARHELAKAGGPPV